jgi:hypothetical protein
MADQTQLDAFLSVFKSKFKSKDVRNVFIDDIRYFDVIDFLIILVKEESLSVWSQVEHIETIAKATRVHAFTPLCTSPVVPMETLVEIMLHMSGKLADELKWACARVLIMHFHRDTMF